MSGFNRRTGAQLRRICASDKALGAELKQMQVKLRMQRTAASASAAAAANGTKAAARALTPESLVYKEGRPALKIYRDEPVMEFPDLKSEEWRARLTGVLDMLRFAVRAVGRIEISDHSEFHNGDSVGTGWLVRKDVLVTNRHVARVFARKNGKGFEFQPNAGLGRVSARVDFLEEDRRAASMERKVVEILHIEDDAGPDMAFLRIGSQDPLPEPVELAGDQSQPHTWVAAIGYPGFDSSIPDSDQLERLYHGVFDKKRIAPGEVMGYDNSVLLHDCSTLNANSGSLVLDLHTGRAVGLHFSGVYQIENRAVPAPIVEQRLRALGL